MIPWHSSFIIERISSNVLKTSSGRTYVLIGKMSKHPNSCKIMLFKSGWIAWIVFISFDSFVSTLTAFPTWFLKKFLFGFPKMWKEYLDQLLSCHTG